MLNNDTHIAQWHPQTQPASRLWVNLERAIVFIIIVTYSGFWIALITGVPSETPTMVGADPGPIARASWFPAYLALLLLLALNIKKVFFASLRFWPIILLLGLCFASISWSLIPDITQRRVIALSFTFLCGFYLAVRGPLIDTLRIIGWAWVAIAIINILIILGMPHWGVHSELHVGAWRGYLIEKNHLGGEMSRANLLFLALLFYDKKNDNGKPKIIWQAGLLLTWMLILGSTSKTALIATSLPYLGVLFYQIAIRTPILGIISLWAGISLLSLGYAVLTLFPEAIVALIGKDLTFTGRTDIWALVIELIDNHKMTGFGYGAFWADENGPSAFIVNTLDWEVPTAHNGWLEVGLALGYPGMILLFAITLFSLFKAGFLATGKHGPFLFLFIIQIVMFSMSESLLMEQNSHASALFFFFLTYVLIAKKVQSDEGPPPLSAPYWAQPPRTTRKR